MAIVSEQFNTSTHENEELSHSLLARKKSVRILIVWFWGTPYSACRNPAPSIHKSCPLGNPLNKIKQLKGSVKEPNMFHKCETEKITRKASDAAENLQLYRVVRFFYPRSLCATHLVLFSERPPIYASSCMMISGGRTEQHVIIAGFGELLWLLAPISNSKAIN